MDRAGVRVYAYSLMPNHYHLLVETPRAKMVEGDEYLIRLSRYLHLNAVRTKVYAGASMEAKFMDLRK